MIFFFLLTVNPGKWINLQLTLYTWRSTWPYKIVIWSNHYVQQAIDINASYKKKNSSLTGLQTSNDILEKKSIFKIQERNDSDVLRATLRAYLL